MPTRSTKRMTADEMREEFHRKAGVDIPCPECKGTEFRRAVIQATIALLDGDGPHPMEAAAIFTIICKHCGYMRQYAP
jgi:predicted nucleic-acid-binding Zn-ribbon protein